MPDIKAIVRTDKPAIQGTIMASKKLNAKIGFGGGSGGSMPGVTIDDEGVIHFPSSGVKGFEVIVE